MSQQGTVVEQKQRFLLSQKHFLSRGIVPSEKLKRIAHDGGVEFSVLKGALDKGTCSPTIIDEPRPVYIDLDCLLTAR